jgi:glycerol dehydrogenase-like iron-containing ADH family enzyme
MSFHGSQITAFPTVFGRDLLSEVPNFVADPYLVVTMADLWPILAPRLPAGTAVHFVSTMDRAALEEDLRQLGDYASIVGLGGGQAIDCAKYFAWRRNLPLHQFPTSLSVDAMYGHRAGVRENGIVRYVGWARPETVYWDLDILAAAPPHINRAGIGDVFCFFTGVWDWQFAHDRGRCEARWPYDETLAAISLARAEAALVGQDAIRDLTPEGVALVVEGFKWGGASYHGAGWCPRHIEGVEHYIFYALEAMTGRKFLHGQAVCLGIVAGAMMHGRRVDELTQAIGNIGVDMRPATMGISWSDVDAALQALPAFVRAQGLPYGIANEHEVSAAFLEELHHRVEEAAAHV